MHIFSVNVGCCIAPLGESVISVRVISEHFVLTSLISESLTRLMYNVRTLLVVCNFSF